MKIINSNICTINLISIERLILSSMDPSNIITPKVSMVENVYIKLKK